MNDNRLRQYMEETWANKHIRVLEQAIKWKFPEIDGLEIVPKPDGTLSIRFNDDGIHTREMVDGFLLELTKNAKS